MSKKIEQSKSPNKARNIISGAIDFIVFAILFGIISIPLVLVLINTTLSEDNIAVSLSLLGCLTGALECLIALFYEILLPYVWEGQTVGMRIMKIKLNDEKVNDIKLRQLIVRAVCSIFSFIFTAGLSLIIEIFVIGLSKDGRSFKDTVAGVVYIDC